MRIVIDSFRGEAPRVSPRLLPPNAAQDATNARLQSGDIESWRQFAVTQGLGNPGPVRSIYLLRDAWLSWEADVDVARGAIAGDESYRAYITGPDVYGEPRYTDYALATSTGSSILPVVTRPLGVPNPASPPTLNVEAGPSPDIAVSDAGDQLSSWIASGTRIQPGVSVSEVEEVPQGNPAPSYRLRNLNNVSSPAFAYRDFGVGNNAVITMVSQFNPTGNGAVLEASWRCACTSGGAGVVAKVGYPFDATGGLQLLLGQSSGWGGIGSWQEVVPMAELDGSGSTWYTSTISVVRNENGTCRVSVTITDSGGGVLATAEVTALFPIGGFCGVEMVTDYQPPAAEFHTLFDNFAISGSGVFQDATANLSTSYVYTFVNDLDQESGPSEASVTIARADGVAVVVTTPTAPPTGYASDYGIERKRIYRAVTGATGTVFRFVAELPLSQADYEDTLSDVQLGEVLQTELFALPPDDLRGILALPNGIMVGFSKNQLCFSAQNYPHAWPVEYRLNTDTAIVGIGNIDNTVVIGTEAFPYLATGNDPAAYSMSKLEVPQACVSKRSFAYLTGLGVVFASPDGLLAIGGNGQVRNLTSGVFTRRQWQALQPETLVAVAHDDTYFFSYGQGLQNQYAFRDTFTGDAGEAIEAHTPDVAPTGFVYSSPGVSLSLTGEGTVVAASATQDGTADSDESDPAFSLSLPLPYTMRLDGMTTQLSNNSEEVAFRISDTANERGIWVGLHMDSALQEYQARIIIGPLDFPSQDLRYTIDGQGPHRLEVTVNTNATLTVMVDGALVATPAISSESILQTPNRLKLYVGREPSVGVFSVLGEVGIITGEAFPAGDRGAYALDMKPDGFGLVPLGCHFVARYADPLTDELHLVLDEVEEPADAYLPLPSTAPDPDGRTIYEFDSPEGEGDMVYRWRGKLNLLERPACFQYAQLRAEDYANLVFRIRADGSLIFERTIAGEQEFTLPVLDEYTEVELEVVGTSRVYSLQLAEAVEELA